MSQHSVTQVRMPGAIAVTLTELSKNGASSRLNRLWKRSWSSYCTQNDRRRDEQGQVAVVRNGNQPKRELIEGLGPGGSAQGMLQVLARPEAKGLSAVSRRERQLQAEYGGWHRRCFYDLRLRPTLSLGLFLIQVQTRAGADACDGSGPACMLLLDLDVAAIGAMTPVFGQERFAIWHSRTLV